MPNRSELARKASSLRDQHEGPRLLVLPNIWDPLGARMLQSMGFPAVATASAAVAFSLGYDDGEIVAFDTMRETIARIARLSIGPGLIRASFAAMRSAAAALQNYGSYDSFTTDAVTSDDIRAICDDRRKT